MLVDVKVSFKLTLLIIAQETYSISFYGSKIHITVISSIINRMLEI